MIDFLALKTVKILESDEIFRPKTGNPILIEKPSFSEYIGKLSKLFKAY